MVAHDFNAIALGLKVSCFIEHGNLIALCMGKLRVVHLLSFDKSCLKRPSLLPQPALSNFYQSCTYELNPSNFILRQANLRLQQLTSGIYCWIAMMV